MRTNTTPRVCAPILFLCSIVGQLQATDCRDSIGIPCSTIVYEHSTWLIGNHVSRLITHGGFRETVANRSDGSSVDFTDTGYTSMYAAPTDQVIRIDNNAGTVSHQAPIIWHDRPYRFSKDGDIQCATGILHFGTDFRLTGDGEVAGIAVKRWERGDGFYWHEEEHLAPSLDCAVLKSYTVRLRLLLQISISSREALSVRLGEPDRNLFVIPANYSEVKDPREDALRKFVARNRSQH